MQTESFQGKTLCHFCRARCAWIPAFYLDESAKASQFNGFYQPKSQDVEIKNQNHIYLAVLNFLVSESQSIKKHTFVRLVHLNNSDPTQCWGWGLSPCSTTRALTVLFLGNSGRRQWFSVAPWAAVPTISLPKRQDIIAALRYVVCQND